MLKKSTKITSLIVAAASVVTMVPAMAATKSLEEKDGTVYKAVAYKDGKFYVDGEVKDDDSAAYYLENGKYTELDDIDNGEEAESYSDKYVNISDGDAYLDLETGKVNEDDNLADDNAYDARKSLEKKIKKDAPEDRYLLGDDNELLSYGYYDEAITSPYVEDWYKFKVEDKDNNGKYYDVYSDAKGNYIDADYDLGKIKLIIPEYTDEDFGKTLYTDEGLTAITKTTGDAADIIKFEKTEAITLENTKDSVKTSNKDYKFKAKYVKDSEVIGQDADYIYRIAYLGIDILDRNDNTVAYDIQSKNDLAFGGVKDIVKVTSGDAIKVLQKISKAQNSDEVDDAKYPKSTETYFFNEYKDFYAKKNKEKYSDRLAGSREVLTGEQDGWAIYNGKVLNYRFDGANFKAQVFTLKDKAGFYYLDKGDSDFDVDDDEFAVTTAADGTIWVLDNGKIKKYQGDGFETVYKCDGAMNAISVYDENNVIVWNEDEDEYAILGGDSTTKEEEEKPETTTSAAGWVQDATTGTWSYVKADGTKATGWFQSPGSGLWYYLDANGIMQLNGWIQDGGYWYFLDATGAMKTGWVYTGGAWYFLKNTAGNMGAMQTGWIQTGGKWYYCNASGAMLSNTTVGGYVLGADGAWIK